MSKTTISKCDGCGLEVDGPQYRYPEGWVAVVIDVYPSGGDKIALPMDYCPTCFPTPKEIPSTIKKTLLARARKRLGL